MRTLVENVWILGTRGVLLQAAARARFVTGELEIYCRLEVEK